MRPPCSRRLLRRDAKGSQDHPSIKRFTGSWLDGYKYADWDQAPFPTASTLKDGKWDAPLTVEGKVTRALYVAPIGKSPLEVFRDEQALTAAGFKRKFGCEGDCGDPYSRCIGPSTMPRE